MIENHMTPPRQAQIQCFALRAISEPPAKENIVSRVKNANWNHLFSIIFNIF